MSENKVKKPIEHINIAELNHGQASKIVRDLSENGKTGFIQRNGKNYYVIMSAWTGTQCDTNTPLHTFFVDKDTSRSNRFKAYNRNCYDTSHSGTDRNSPKDLCYSSDPSDTFVVAYFVEK